MTSNSNKKASKLAKSGKQCDLSGKKAIKGWRYSFLRSHFNRTAKRRFEVNLQKIKTFDENGTPVTIKVAASILKRCPDIKTNITAYTQRNKIKRLKGRQKRELLKAISE